MQKEHLDQLEYMCRMYGVYGVTKALAEYASKTSKEYKQHDNDEAIIHKDTLVLKMAVYDMRTSHPLRSMRDGS